MKDILHSFVIKSVEFRNFSTEEISVAPEGNYRVLGGGGKGFHFLTVENKKILNFRG